jgi:DNA processing protein
MNSHKYLLRLYGIKGVGSQNARKLIAYAGGIEKVFSLPKKQLLAIPGVNESIVNSILDTESLKRAENELEFIEKNNIRLVSYYSDEFPPLLKQCEDSPLLLFVKGNAINHSKRCLGMVGTRNATARGEEFCNKLVADLKQKGHDVVIVSGLAFGVDIASHKAALDNNMETWAVLGHGMHTIYPAAHSNIAKKITGQGTLITEYFRGGFADKSNFVRRNRIIAGLCEAIVVVESDETGGSMITADLANGYNREVFAVPGRIEDKYSKGCNKLIKTHRANLIQGVEDIEYILGWNTNPKNIQKQLFVELTPDEQVLYDIIKDNDNVTIDELCRISGFPIAKASLHLLNLEFNGQIKCLPGKVYICC